MSLPLRGIPHDRIGAADHAAKVHRCLAFGPIRSLGSRRLRPMAAVAWVSIVVTTAVATLPAHTSADAATALAGASVVPGEAFGESYLDGVSGPRPTRTENLAGTWQFRPVARVTCAAPRPLPVGPIPGCVETPADGSTTTIQVPGGGWVKQGFTDVSHAVYSRTITIPDTSAPQVTKLVLGAVNHEAVAYIRPAGSAGPGPGELIGRTMTSFTPASFDLTPHVEPGRTYVVSIEVKGRYALRDAAGFFLVPEAAGWSPDVAQGIFRTAHLEVYPVVHVSDVFVRTSVDLRTLTYDVTVVNDDSRDRWVVLGGALSSANEAGWSYPSIPTVRALVRAGATRTVRVGPVSWQAGVASYWWPNVPYRKGYRAQLHDLAVSLQSDAPGTGASRTAATVRFGFRQIRQVGGHYELNRVRVNFRGDSLTEADYDSIDFGGGRGDAYGTYPGFRAPSATNPGWPQAVNNYQRLNFNVVRVHQIPATPYMLDVADAMGLMLVGESAIRGSNLHENFLLGRSNMIEHVKALVRRDRNHASVLRWSVSNEPYSLTGVNGEAKAANLVTGAPPGSGPLFDEALYQAARSEDPTRPIFSDGNPNDLPHADYTTFCHYSPSEPSGAPPYPLLAFGEYTDDVCEGLPAAGKPNGQTEFIATISNTPRGFAWFATATKEMREKGAEDTRPYALLAAWASVIPGVRTTDMTLENPGPPLYGEDNLPEPWSHPLIRRTQAAYSPVLVADSDYWRANKLSDAEGRWPAVPVRLERGVPTTRRLVIFNDTLAGARMTVRWTLRSGSPDGAVVAGDRLDLEVPVGTSVHRTIMFTPVGHGPLYLVLSAVKPGEGQLFVDDGTRFD